MVKVDQNKCIGCGLCSGLCPDIFQMNADNKSTVVKEEVNECSKNAAESCPVGAITVK